FAACDRKRNSAVRGVDECFGRQRFLFLQRSIESRDHNLLDLGAAESVGRFRKRLEIERRRILLSQEQVNPKDLLALVRRRQIDEEDLVEAPLAQQLRGNVHQIVRGSDYENIGVLFLKPGQ